MTKLNKTKVQNYKRIKLSSMRNLQPKDSSRHFFIPVSPTITPTGDVQLDIAMVAFLSISCLVSSMYFNILTPETNVDLTINVAIRATEHMDQVEKCLDAGKKLYDAITASLTLIEANLPSADDWFLKMDVILNPANESLDLYLCNLRLLDSTTANLLAECKDPEIIAQLKDISDRSFDIEDMIEFLRLKIEGPGYSIHSLPFII